MIITLNPKDKLVVRFAGTDGEFEIHFDTTEYPKQLLVRETAGISGNRAGAAGAVLHHEDFLGFSPSSEDDTDEETGDLELDAANREIPITIYPVARTERVGFFVDAEGRVQCTQLVYCEVVEARGRPGDFIVETLSKENEVTGTFTFYETMDQLETALGYSYPQITI